MRPRTRRRSRSAPSCSRCSRPSTRCISRASSSCRSCSRSCSTSCSVRPSAYLARIQIPPPAGAAIVVLLLLGGVGGGVYALAGPAQTLANSAPRRSAKANTKLRSAVPRALPERDEPGRAGGERHSAIPRPAAPPRQVVVSTHADDRLSHSRHDADARRRDPRDRDPALLPARRRRSLSSEIHQGAADVWRQAQAVNVARATEAAVSAYLSTALLVNVGEGVVVALALWGARHAEPRPSGER